jgi:hypothetical protein
MIMSLEISRFVYRCALVVDLLLSIAFIVLSGIVPRQRETSFPKMVELCGIAYFAFAAISLLSKDDLFTVPLLVLVLATVGFGVPLLIVSLVKSECSPLSIVLVILFLLYVVITMILGYRAMDDDTRL